jgi:hypothetical protein
MHILLVSALAALSSTTPREPTVANKPPVRQLIDQLVTTVTAGGLDLAKTNLPDEIARAIQPQR